ncbi:MAG: L-2-hydroxyglutarate oxidase, partial [Candidatus Marinimicrobia bacterium]|nr:L-2-hydroxyglutarate oxidase [Candidatus Neomarinimicrobiota bacterium]
MAKSFDIAIIGGGIVGMASAKTLVNKTEASLIVLEAEDQLAAHQTGNNSGVIHSGLYYKPGSLKASTCTDGREALYTFCEEHGVAYERCGKVVVATAEEEIPRLQDLQERGTANGLRGLTWLSGEEIKEYEPHVTGVAGLYVPQTGIVDYTEVTSKYADIVKSRDGEIRTNAEVIDCRQDNNEFILVTPDDEIRCKNVINCAGLQSDRVARMFGAEPDVKIVPFRGEYYELKPEKHHLVNNLIYPVPDPKFPFLGVHFTRMIHGGVEAGPNAVLALE